jgi:hypothetical protein
MSRRAINVIRVVWILATLLLMATWREDALFLFLPLAVLGPLLREAVPGEDQDERQRTLDYRASHVALMVVYVLLFVLFAKMKFVEGRDVANELWLILAVPLIVRVVMFVGQGSGARRLGLGVGLTFGGIWLAFTLLSHGLSWGSLGESLIGGAILAATALSLRSPRSGGALLVAIGLVFLGVFAGANVVRGQFSSGIFIAATLAFPPLIAGIALIASARGSKRALADEFADLRAPSTGGKG